MDVHLRELRYFVAVAEHLSFTRAAEALYVSQPALSKQIRALEVQLHGPLFTRDRRTVQLAPAGEALLPGARAVLAAWEQAQAELAAATTERRATLVVGFSTGLGRGLLPAIRARLAENAPHAALRIRQISWDDPTGGLIAEGRDRTDAAFVGLPLADPGSYDWIEVATDPASSPCPGSTRSPAATTSTSPICSTSRSWHYPPALAASATSGSPRMPATAVRRSSAPRSPAPRRRSKR